MATPPEPQPGALPWSRLAKTAAALLLGIIIGFMGITRGCAPSAQAGGISQERYAVVIANLFAEGESLRSVIDYVPALDTDDPSGFFIRLADRYAKSTDRQRQRWAEDLRQLGEALAKGVPAEGTPPSSSPFEASPPAPPSPAGQALPPSAITPSTPTVTAATGVIKSQGEGGVRLRAEPTTSAPALALLGNGVRVEIINVVDGQSVEGNERRWYKVRGGQRTGYVYFPYLAPAD